MHEIERMMQEQVKRRVAAFQVLLTGYASKMERWAKENRPWKDRTGHAKQGIQGGLDIEPDNLFILYMAHTMHYGEYLETGTGIHGPKKRPIKPINKKALYWPGLPRPVKQSKGMKPQPILRPTVQKFIPLIIKDIKKL
jgi:hypothetical protein